MQVTKIKTRLISVSLERLLRAKMETNQNFPLVIAGDGIRMRRGLTAILDDKSDRGMRRLKKKSVVGTGI